MTGSVILKDFVDRLVWTTTNRHDFYKFMQVNRLGFENVGSVVASTDGIVKLVPQADGVHCILNGVDTNYVAVDITALLLWLIKNYWMHKQSVQVLQNAYRGIGGIRGPVMRLLMFAVFFRISPEIIGEYFGIDIWRVLSCSVTNSMVLVREAPLDSASFVANNLEALSEFCRAHLGKTAYSMGYILEAIERQYRHGYVMFRNGCCSGFSKEVIGRYRLKLLVDKRKSAAIERNAQYSTSAPVANFSSACEGISAQHLVANINATLNDDILSSEYYQDVSLTSIFG